MIKVTRLSAGREDTVSNGLGGGGGDGRYAMFLIPPGFFLVLFLATLGCSKVEVDCKSLTVKVEGAETGRAMAQAAEMLKDCPKP